LLVEKVQQLPVARSSRIDDAINQMIWFMVMTMDNSARCKQASKQTITQFAAREIALARS